MLAAARLFLFACLLVALFGLSWVLGVAVGPINIGAYEPPATSISVPAAGTTGEGGR